MTAPTSVVRNYVLTIVWAIFIFIISTIPGKDIPKFDWTELFTIDKWVHLGVYGILVYSFLRAYYRKHLNISNPELIKIGLIAAAIASAYGWSLEYIQEHYCEGRLFEVFDGVANTAGAFLFFGIFYWQRKKTR